MIKHVVMFKFKGDDANIEIARAALLGMEGKIPLVRSFELGKNVVNASIAYDLIAITGLDSVDDIKPYRRHPEHQKVVEILKPIVEAMVSVDYLLP